MTADEIPPVPSDARREERTYAFGTETVVDAGPHRWRVDDRGVRVYIEYADDGSWKRAWSRAPYGDP